MDNLFADKYMCWMFTNKAIEASVTAGLGYDSITDFSKTGSIYRHVLKPEDVKNTQEGLQAHLREMECPEFEKWGFVVGHIYSFNGRRMNIRGIGSFTYEEMLNKNQRMIDKAYNAEAQRRGRVSTLVKGFMRKIFGGNPFFMADYFLSQKPA